MSEPAASFTQPGRQGRLSPAEIDALLARPLIAHLACHDGAGWPYVVPVWFEWDSDGFWIIPRARSAWAAYLQADPRVGLSIDDPTTSQRVVAQGQADLIEVPNVGGQWVAIAERMVARYRGEAGRAYLEATRAQPRWLFLVRLTRLWTWKGGGWHERYAR